MAKTKRKRKLKPLSQKLIDWWHPTLNWDLRSEDVSGGMGINVWFLHYDEKWKQWHEWEAKLNNINQTVSCAICTGQCLVIGLNDLATRNPTVSARWHPVLNGDLTAQMVTEHSDEVRWWQHYHEKTGKWHEWPMRVNNLTKKNPQGCSVCSGRRIQVGVNDLATTHSFLASEWHPTLNGALTAQMVTRGSGEEIWWRKNCFNDGVYHEWHAMPNSRTRKKPTGCAICRGSQVQVGVNDLASQRPDISEEWDHIKNGKLTPQMVTVGSGIEVFWKHTARSGSIHDWPAVIAQRTKARPTGCPESECSKGGFDPALPAHLYILSDVIDKIQVVQFGISNDIRARLIDHARSGFTNTPVRIIPFPVGSNARALELSFLNLMRDADILSCNKVGIKFDGSTEAFCLKDTDEEFLEEFMELVGI